MKFGFILSLVVAIFFALNGCSKKYQEKIGMVEKLPDEYQVEKSKGLEIPPHYKLHIDSVEQSKKAKLEELKAVEEEKRLLSMEAEKLREQAAIAEYEKEKEAKAQKRKKFKRRLKINPKDTQVEQPKINIEESSPVQHDVKNIEDEKNNLQESAREESKKGSADTVTTQELDSKLGEQKSPEDQKNLDVKENKVKRVQEPKVKEVKAPVEQEANAEAKNQDQTPAQETKSKEVVLEPEVPLQDNADKPVVENIENVVNNNLDTKTESSLDKAAEVNSTEKAK